MTPKRRARRQWDNNTGASLDYNPSEINPMARLDVHRSNRRRNFIQRVGNRRVDRTPTEQREAGVDRAT
jgi:hypothetical protein